MAGQMQDRRFAVMRARHLEPLLQPRQCPEDPECLVQAWGNPRFEGRLTVGEAVSLPELRMLSPKAAEPPQKAVRIAMRKPFDWRHGRGLCPHTPATGNRRDRVLGCACGPHHSHRFPVAVATPHASPAGQVLETAPLQGSAQNQSQRGPPDGQKQRRRWV